MVVILICDASRSGRVPAFVTYGHVCPLVVANWATTSQMQLAQGPTHCAQIPRKARMHGGDLL